MKKAEVLEEYYLEENNTEDIDLVGWKVIGKIDHTKVTYHGNFSLKTTTEGWLDEFGIHVITSSGLVLVSDNCPFLMKDDILDAVTKYIESDEFKSEEAAYVGALLSNPSPATTEIDDISKWLDTTKIGDCYPTWTYTPATTDGIYRYTDTVTNSLDSALTSTYTTDASNYITCSSADGTYTTVSTSALADAISASIANYTATATSTC